MNFQIETISKKISDTYKTSIEYKNKKIDEFLNNMKNIDNEKKDKDDLIYNKIIEIEYLLEHNNLLMMKLANKGILSEREINEMDNRSYKKIRKI